MRTALIWRVIYDLNTTLSILTHRTAQRWNRSGFSRPDPTGKFQNLRRSTGFFTGFCSLFNASNEKFSKGGYG